MKKYCGLIRLDPVYPTTKTSLHHVIGILYKILRIPPEKLLDNIGITHVFSCINICRIPRMLFEHEADRPRVQHHPRDPASVNAMKQTCVIVILAYFTLFQPNSH